MIDFLKDVMRPVTITTLLMLLTPGVILLNVPSLARWGRRWVTALIAVYWILSCPITVDLMAKTLTRGYRPIASRDEARDTDAIVLLSGGSTNVRAGGRQVATVVPGSALRAIETARLFTLLGEPLVIASGGVTDHEPGAAPETTALHQALVALGVAPHRIALESKSHNTRDAALVVKEMLRERGLSRIVLVTSPMHMGRSMSAFAAVGLHPVPAVGPLTPDRSHKPFALLPDETSLWVADAVVYEWAARLYYWWRGWLA